MFFCKELYCFHLVPDLGGSQVAQWLQGGAQEEARHQEGTEGPLKGLWAPQTPSHA